MADPKQLDLIRRDVGAWNWWRTENPELRPDLRRASLSEANLSRANLSHSALGWANLIRADLSRADLGGADLGWTNFNRADLREADLSRADLRGANLMEANLMEANLMEANLMEADFRGANLSGADLIRADLREANFRGANLSGANLREANLRGANLRKANLTEARLHSARLQTAALDGAILTGVRLWETQRAGWVVKGVTCERASWDEDDAEVIQYAPGEFERLYSEQPRIELFYKDGLTKFELNTLPALLKHLATLNPGCSIRLKSIQETGSGAKVSISVEDVDSGTLEEIKIEAVRAQAAQVALRDDPAARWEIEKRLLLDEVFPRMLAAAGQHVEITGSATGVVIASGHASVNAQQHINDLSAIQPLLDEVISRRGELPLTDDQVGQLEDAIRDVQGELQKAQPKYPVISEGLKMVRDFAVEATGGAAGAALAAGWNPLLEKLGHFIHLLARG